MRTATLVTHRGDALAGCADHRTARLCSGLPLQSVLAGGFIEWPQALPDDVVAALSAELTQLHAAGRLIDSAQAGFSIVNGKFEDASTRGRSDHFTRMDEGEADAAGYPAVAAAIRMLKAFAHELSYTADGSTPVCRL